MVQMVDHYRPGIIIVNCESELLYRWTIEVVITGSVERPRQLFVLRRRVGYFGHVTRHNGLEKTIMQGMVAGKRSRGKPRQRWEKDITDTFGTMTAASRVAEDRKQFRSDIWAATS